MLLNCVKISSEKKKDVLKQFSCDVFSRDVEIHPEL